MQLQAHLDQLAVDAALLRRAAEWAGLEATVPSCPNWQVRRLVQHVAKVHRWASWIVAGKDQDEFSFVVPGDDELFEAFSAGAAHLIFELRSASPHLNVPTFLPADSPRDFWARRQSHETAIHRVDAELAADYGVSEFEAQFAADGLAELFLGFGPARFDTTAVRAPFAVTFTPIDVNPAWTVRVAPDGVQATTEARDDSELTVFGTASDLYRWAWNRAGDDDVSLRGDVALSDVWRSFCVVGAR
ncbi:MAG: hypothetical protein QOK10_2821 [Pseudonocardiales bacterium]|nr:hypothetical protein [Pseudonocardiales bacterium]